MTIQETAAAARAEGLSYGQYVVLHRDEPALRETPSSQLVRRCLVCGGRFWVKSERSRQIYCSQQCCDDRKRTRKERPPLPPRTCDRCGRTYVPNRYAPHQKYCSPECRDHAKWAREREARRNDAP